MKEIRARMLVTALDVLIQHTAILRDQLNASLGDESGDIYVDLSQIEAFDEALGVALDARNEYCDEAENPIEDGTLSWKKNRVQREEDAAEGSNE